MEFAYIYGDPGRLYLNATNRCTNHCSFCVRQHGPGLGEAVLWGGDEPDRAGLLAAIESKGGLRAFSEFIWCGFGEPTFRLDLIAEAAPYLRSRGAKIRLNTNGHACLIHGRDVLPDLAVAVDSVSVSLNAPDADRYVKLSRPFPQALRMSPNPDVAAAEPPAPERFWEAMLDFLRRAPGAFREVQASVVGFVLDRGEIEACRELAAELGVRKFRVR